MLLDTHHHLDFLAPELRGTYLAALPDDVETVAQTLTPSGFMELLDWAPALTAAGEARPRLSVGFHPWCVASAETADAELAVFARALHQTRFVGEIGLDHTPRRAADAPIALQRHVLHEALRLVRDAAPSAPGSEPYVLSIHAVRATTDVLDMLAELDVVGAGAVPVIHRYAGTSDELTRLVRLGGCISVGPQVLASKRGRAYVSQVPADRLLLETDLPAGPVTTPAAVAATADATCAALRETVAHLRELRGDGVIDDLARNQARLYG